MSSDDEGISHSVSFSIGPGDLREVDDDAVAAFDAALERVGSGEVNHFIDPQRLQRFESGGPPVWSVATVPTDGGILYLTYGFSEAVDPARVGADFEMSVLVPGEPTMWPPLLLRALCRYMLGSRRPLEPGQSMPFPDAITRFFAPPAERESYPATELNAAIFAVDPRLPAIETPRGVVEVRRVIGLRDVERHLLDLWSAQGFLGTLATRDPDLATVLDRAPYTEDAQFVATIREGSRREGSQVAYVAVPGVAWGQDENNALHVQVPGGAYAAQIHAMVQARLPFGRHLLVHDLDPERSDAVAFEPGDAVGFRAEGDTLVMTVPADHPLFDALVQAGDAPSVKWTFGG
ncbi:MAG: suppressor of fused domain protein [Myxococcota bacterium]